VTLIRTTCEGTWDGGQDEGRAREIEFFELFLVPQNSRSSLGSWGLRHSIAFKGGAKGVPVFHAWRDRPKLPVKSPPTDATGRAISLVRPPVSCPRAISFGFCEDGGANRQFPGAGGDGLFRGHGKNGQGPLGTGNACFFPPMVQPRFLFKPDFMILPHRGPAEAHAITSSKTITQRRRDFRVCGRPLAGARLRPVPSINRNSAMAKAIRGNDFLAAAAGLSRHKCRLFGFRGVKIDPGQGWFLQEREGIEMSRPVSPAKSRGWIGAHNHKPRTASYEGKNCDYSLVAVFRTSSYLRNRDEEFRSVQY